MTAMLRISLAVVSRSSFRAASALAGAVVISNYDFMANKVGNFSREHRLVNLFRELLLNLSILGPVYAIPFSYENGMKMLPYENGIA